MDLSCTVEHSFDQRHTAFKTCSILFALPDGLCVLCTGKTATKRQRGEEPLATNEAGGADELILRARESARAPRCFQKRSSDGVQRLELPVEGR